MNKMIILLAVLLQAAAASAQYYCGTDSVHQKLRRERPEIDNYAQQLEEHIRSGMGLKIDRLMAKTTNDTPFLDIPVVIHIVHDYGPEYLSDSSIHAAFKNWSDAFLGYNADTADVILPFKKYIGQSRIRLHLATIDPEGKPTKGILRHHSYLSYQASDQAKLHQWPQNSYLNIWLVQQFPFQGLVAYAFFPSTAAAYPQYDGVIALSVAPFFGKTIPHEIGHIFHLEHTWGNNNQPGVVCGDDGVDDTPPTKGHSNTGCTAATLYDTACATGYGVATADGYIDYPDTVNAQNIMDYSYCHKMFTVGQAARMRSTLSSGIGGRNNLVSDANIAATGALHPMPDLPPVADFSVENSRLSTERSFFLCMGDNYGFVFKNRSWNDTITAIEWQFSNQASVKTSNNRDKLTNTFAKPGWVTVSIAATGNNSGTHTFTDTAAVYVADTNMITPDGYIQEFSSASEMSSWPMFNYYKNQFRWEWFNGAGYGSEACVRYRSYDDRGFPQNATGTPVGDYDDIVTPGFDLSGYTGNILNLNFFTAGARRAGNPLRDSLQILVSNDCGLSWKIIALLGGADIANNRGSINGAEFVPSSPSMWKAQTIQVPLAYHTERIFFKFRYKPSAAGNNFYMDRFSLSPHTTEIETVLADNEDVTVFPNPSDGNCKLVCFNKKAGDVAIEIKDMTGRIIYLKKNFVSVGPVAYDLSRSIFPMNGIYFISVINQEKRLVRKLVIE